MRERNGSGESAVGVPLVGLPLRGVSSLGIAFSVECPRQESHPWGSVLRVISVTIGTTAVVRWRMVTLITLDFRGASVSIACACIRFGRAVTVSGSDFDSDQSRSVYLVPLIALQV